MSNDTLPLRRALLGWYRRHRRPLPWRATRDPYRIWVSEVMLQQTQVAAVRPYYGAFLRRFPTLPALARAREDDVLAAWSGLGYYRRARHLREAARRIVRDHGGRVPGDPVALRSLPGVGRYTAGAVLSIAFDQPLPVLDGNVGRVLSRLFAVRGSIKESQGARRLWKLAGSLVPMRRPGEWNQALMELGALVCAPRAPRCESCPVRRWCRAHAAGRPEAFPSAPLRRKPERVRRAVAWIERGGRVLMARRTGSLLTGLWEPPGVDLKDGEPAEVALATEMRRLGLRVTLGRMERSVHHTITHRRIHVQTWRGELHGRMPRSAILGYVDPGRPAVATTGLTRKLAGQVGALGRSRAVGPNRQLRGLGT